MPAALEFWTGELLVKFTPVVDSPGRYFEVLDFVTEVGHVLCGECFV
jgi:hypothetical protein